MLILPNVKHQTPPLVTSPSCLDIEVFMAMLITHLLADCCHALQGPEVDDRSLSLMMIG